MAFAAASGYGQLPNGKWSPTIFSQKALKSFRKKAVAEDLVNNSYFGEVANFGDSVKIIREPSIVISELQRGTTPATQDLLDDDLTITVDQARYFQFAVDDIEKAHSHVDWEDLASDRAGYECSMNWDSHLLNYIATNAATTNYVGATKAGSTETVSAIKVATGVTPGATAFTPLGLLNRLKRRMDMLNIPDEDRYVVASPMFWEQIGDEDSKLMHAYLTGDDKSPLYNGKVMTQKLRGFELYSSNNLPTVGAGEDAAAGTGTNYGTLIAGHRSAVAAVTQISKVETFRSPNRFADICRGMFLGGRAVIRPEALFTVRYTVK